jgi:hypothetical protein
MDYFEWFTINQGTRKENAKRIWVKVLEKRRHLMSEERYNDLCKRVL